MSEQSDKLMKARCRLLTRDPWYGHVAMSMVWIPSQMPWLPDNRVKTMGVRIVNGGEVQCLYYPGFVDSLNIKELYAVIQHEIEHIVRCHCLRVGGRQPEMWNIAADMTVNGVKSNPRIGYKESGETIVPHRGEIIWIPDSWPKDETSEHYYSRIEKQAGKCCDLCGRPSPGKGQGNQQSPGKGQKGKGQGSQGKGQGQQPDDSEGEGEGQGNGNSCSKCGSDLNSGVYSCGGISGHSIDDHSVWNQSDVSEDEARQIVKDIVDQASAKSQGNVPGHLAEAIKALGKPVVRWRELLRRYLGNHVGNRRNTFSRASRRYPAFGTPGVSHHAAANVNVIIDTSGSVGTKELEQFFSEIDTISSRAKTMVLQWDHAFQGYSIYRKGDWKKFKVHGRGGTDMAAPVKWLQENQRVADVQVMLTDGFCNWAPDPKFPFITVITSEQPGPGWGHEVHMKVK